MPKLPLNPTMPENMKTTQVEGKMNVKQLVVSGNNVFAVHNDGTVSTPVLLLPVHPHRLRAAVQDYTPADVLPRDVLVAPTHLVR